MRLHLGRDLFGRPVPLSCSDDKIEVREIPKPQADDLIRKGHYSGSVVWSSNFHLGVFADGQCIGAIQMGPGMNPASGSSVVADTPPDGWIELNRMWLAEDKPDNCATRALSGAFRLLRHIRPHIQWVQSFADERCGRLGAVYQAANFTYCGSHETTFLELDGEWFHQSMLGRAEYDKRGWWSGPKIQRLHAGLHRATRHNFRQFRYLYFIDRRARKRLVLSELPYPKPGTEALARSSGCTS